LDRATSAISIEGSAGHATRDFRWVNIARRLDYGKELQVSEREPPAHVHLGMALKKAREWLTHTGVLVSRPAAFLIFALYGMAWIVVGDGLKWHSIATLATWGMTLVIQRAEHRDTQAIHAKLDELLRANGEASNRVMRIDDKDAEEVERERKKVRAS
jgi:low affinity Fe/Cu permease